MNTTNTAPEVLRLANAAHPSTMVRGGNTLTVRVTRDEWPSLDYVGANGIHAVLVERDRVRAAASWDAYSHGLSVVRITDGFATLDTFPVDPRPFLPREGMRVEFPSKSARGGTRYGRVVWTKGAQTRVSYKFTDPRSRGESEKTVATRTVRPARG